MQQRLLEKWAARSAQTSLALHSWEGSSNDRCGAQPTNSLSSTNTSPQKVESTFLPLLTPLGCGEVGWHHGQVGMQPLRIQAPGVNPAPVAEPGNSEGLESPSAK